MAALAAILLPAFLHAQITFKRTYGGSSDDLGYSVEQTVDGGYVVAGTTRSFGAGGWDVYLIKTDSIGDTLWTKTFGDTNAEVGYSICQTSDGGCIIAGKTEGLMGNGDAYVVKTDANGETLWTRTYGVLTGSANAVLSVQQTGDSGYILAGYEYLDGDSRVHLIKTNPSGDTLWTKHYIAVHTQEYFGESVEQTKDGGYIIAGHTNSHYDSHGDAYLVKTNAEGDSLWTRRCGGSGNDQGYSVRQAADGGYITAGYTRSYGAGGADVYLIKTDVNGDTLWTHAFGGASDDVGYSVQQTADSDYIIAGYTCSFGAGDADVHLIKTDQNGHAMWTRTFGGTGDDVGYSVEQTADGGYIVAGYTNSLGAGGDDVYLIKTDSMGLAVAEQKANSTRASALSLSCEPNPSSGTTTVRLSPFALRLSPLTLRMYDSQGRMVLSREVSTSSFPLSTSDLPSGAYFIRCDAAGEHATARLVLQR